VRAVAILLLALAFTGCAPRPDPGNILLFGGRGTSPGDVRAVEEILDRERLAYLTVDSSDLNAMDEARLRAHRLLIVPGGNFVHMGEGLAPVTAVHVRTAVQGGLNYLGICAGALLAGNARENGFNLTAGVRFGFYRAVNQGINKAVVPIASAAGPTLDQYWEDGPELSNWGAVVAKYPDGTPAVTEGAFGNGWVVLSGVHPEAPEGWRRGMSFATPADVDHAFAVTLIRAALNRESLPHY
jgi:glutamine amidotransferase-like uncharacterized protein